MTTTRRTARMTVVTLPTAEQIAAANVTAKRSEPRGYVAVKIEYVDARTEMLNFTANKDIIVQGTHGATVTIKAGEKFHAVRAGSLGEDMWYLVRPSLKGMKRCSCAANSPCVHEIRISTGKPLAELRAAKTRKTANPVVVEAPIVETVNEPAPASEYRMSDALVEKLAAVASLDQLMKRTSLKSERNQGFSLMR
jgi:hypothetical protein